MPTLRRRIATTFVLTLLLAATSTFAGYFLAREITARVTLIRLDNYASQLMTSGENSAAEVRSALAAVDASPYHSCSTAGIKYFRALIFQSEFLQDAGWMHDDGQIECSAALGRMAQPNLAATPDFFQQDGTQIYKSLAPYRNSSLTAITLQRGKSFVVFVPQTRMYIQPPPMHFTQTVTDSPTQKLGPEFGEPLQADRSILITEGKVWSGDRLYATRCSIAYFTCLTAFTTLPEIVQANRTKFTGCIVICGMLGAFAGLILSLLYRRNKSMEQQLRRAIRRDRVRVVYQPLIDLESGSIVGAEALARWNDENGNAVRPDIFVRAAEEHGFVGQITRLVLRHILKDFGPTLRARPEFHVSLNVSAEDLADSAFLAMLETSLAQAKVPPQSLTIEITESSTVRRDQAVNTIHSLRERGHSIHIDDFGTGYSSLSYLHDLSVDAIKIDRSFTQSIGTGSVTVAILPQILAMAEALKLQVVVEGVETPEQAAYFAEAKLPVLMQGWLYGRPVPAAEFHRILSRSAKKQVQRDERRPALASVA